MKFLIQTINNQVVHDFSFTLINSIEYHKWLRKSQMDYVLSERPDVENCIPVGTVEFVRKYILKYHNKLVLPLNIPEQLLAEKFTCRKVINGTEKDITSLSFVKSNERIKAFTEMTSTAPKGFYQISELIEIDSEYRCFVYRNKLVGLHNYSGEFTIFPDLNFIDSCIKAYTKASVAYTLDIGINSLSNFVIECHDFFSCGLYGFADHRIYPFMLRDWFNYFIRD